MAFRCDARPGWLAPEQTGWLAGLRDHFVGRAIAALHREPAREGTLESLSREVGRNC
jgi:hypothetical protein